MCSENVLFVSLWKRWRRKALRDAIRGYRTVSSQGRQDTVDEICSSLATSALPARPDQFSPWIYGAAIRDAELATRQVLYLRFGLYKITAPLFTVLGGQRAKLSYPLPSSWIDSLREQAIAVAGLRSRLLWLAAVLGFWAYGCLTVLKLAFGAAVNRGNVRQFGNFAHFEYIGEAQTPRPGPDGQSHDVMTWYRAWSGRDHSVRTLTFRMRKPVAAVDPNVTPLQFPLNASMKASNQFRFWIWGIGAIALSLFDILRGRWWHALMLHEAAQARFFALVEPEALARDYLFNNSGWFQRPLWTYEAQRRGSRILFYHYSTNSAQFKTATGYRSENHAWSLSNWPQHLVWDQENADFVQRAVELPTKVEIVGPIWFASSPAAPPTRTGPSIAVFDITPFRSSKAPSLALVTNYYLPATCSAFVSDVAQASADNGFRMMWKRKRNIGKAAHPLYRATVADIDAKSQADIILADHSPIRVIEAADAVVSLPFTSTAHLARHMGKPSCYYDPTGTVQKDDRSAHDIPILHGYDELQSWIRAVRAKMTIMDEN